MTVKDLRLRTKLSQTSFADYFGIPVRSLQEWEQDRRTPPPYLVPLLYRLLVSEKQITEFKNMEVKTNVY